MNPAPSLYLNVIKIYQPHFIKAKNQSQNSFDKEIALNKSRTFEDIQRKTIKNEFNKGAG